MSRFVAQPLHGPARPATRWAPPPQGQSLAKGRQRSRPPNVAAPIAENVVRGLEDCYTQGDTGSLPQVCKMEITWLGHSCLRIRSNEVTLITDPYGDSLGISLGRQKAEIVTVSHPHPNHSDYHAIEGSPRVLKSPGEYEIADFYITGMGTERNDPEGERQVNTVFTIRCEGVTLCHLGT